MCSPVSVTSHIQEEARRLHKIGLMLYIYFVLNETILLFAIMGPICSWHKAQIKQENSIANKRI